MTSRRSVWLMHGSKDTHEAVVERLRRRAAGEQANREMMQRFGPLTPENAQEAIAWQDNRIMELMR